MAELTENLLLEMPAEDEYYDVGVFNRNMKKIDQNTVKSATLAGITVLSQDTYDNITPAEDVLYLTDTGAMYLGSLQLGSTTPSSSPAVLAPDYTGTEGAAAVLEMEES